ncbi:MAG TPA: DUF6516 family protein [Thermodesulfobacteriota bacterium]|nr:DUF6516 family protein [Thermodesulfobacteriota bacterium]
MRGVLIHHTKVTDEPGNTVEIKIWKLPKTTKGRPHGYKYSLVYVVNGERVLGYDNSEGKGDHRHYKDREEPCRFTGIDRLFEDFYDDVRRFMDEG